MAKGKMSKCKGCPHWKWVRKDTLYDTRGYHYCEKNELTTCMKRNMSSIDSLPDESCKDSLQVQETCKENAESFTSLEEVARLYADDQIPTDYPDYFCRQDIKDAFIAGAEWQREKMKKEEVEGAIWEAINRYELEKKLNHEEGD